MKRHLVWGLIGLVISITAQADNPQQVETKTYVDEPIVGWHWYNEPQPEEDEEPPEPEQIPLSSLSPTLQKKVMQKLTEEALDTAIMQPSPQNALRYMAYQRFWLEQSGKFERSVKKGLLLDPALDYNLEHSHYNSTVPLQLSQLQNKEKAAIQSLSSEYGVFFFYRGQDPLDNQLATVVRDFAQSHNIALIPVSVDGVRSEALPDTRPDTGQVAKMGITHFPALFLVDPKSEHYQPLAYGFMTQDALARRFLDVATDFKPNY
ncbi:type-F conjugative transfer system pilin assembly protein TraF (plasmid) [Providencia sp. R33]|uniref:type-F conjugative transfer system pilin assembly protein TraF n=1 Tax=Providencia sp. R33 TaxID=2828763 RepID=UPI001C5B465F|nr:type-F conjugative transfer system pilin assembly protein TraF [Providencia sp. R33]